MATTIIVTATIKFSTIILIVYILINALVKFPEAKQSIKKWIIITLNVKTEAVTPTFPT